MTEYLFVYGTLGPGKPNEHILAVTGSKRVSGDGYYSKVGEL